MKYDFEAHFTSWAFFLFDPTVVPHLAKGGATRAERAISVELEIKKGNVLWVGKGVEGPSIRILVEENPDPSSVRISSPYTERIPVPSGEMRVAEFTSDVRAPRGGSIRMAPGNYEATVLEPDWDEIVRERLRSEGIPPQSGEGTMIGTGCGLTILFGASLGLLPLFGVTIESLLLWGGIGLAVYWLAAIMAYQNPRRQMIRSRQARVRAEIEEDAPDCIVVLKRV